MLLGVGAEDNVEEVAQQLLGEVEMELEKLDKLGVEELDRIFVTSISVNDP